MRRVWVVVLVFAPAACLFPDLGGLQTGGSPDACSACVDAAPLDVVTDTKPPPVDASDAGFCASLGGTHTLCEDFDNGLFSAKFTNVHTTPVTSIGSDGTEFVSPPLSLFASIPAQPTNGDDAFMTRVFTATASSLTYSFDLRIDSWTTGDQSGIFAAIVIDDGLPTFHTMSIYTTDTYTALEEAFRQPDGGNAYIDHVFVNRVTLGTWMHVSLTMDLTQKTCSATLDGQTAVATEPIDSSWTPGPVNIDLGFSYVNSEAQPWQAHYDDVVFDAQ